MSQSKLHVLDLIVVSKYLPTPQITKLKYISKSFKDIQERILINWNPQYNINDTIKMFPNIQTIKLTSNEPAFVIRIEKTPFDVNRDYDDRKGFLIMADKIKVKNFENHFNEYIKHIINNNQCCNLKIEINIKVVIQNFLDKKHRRQCDDDTEFDMIINVLKSYSKLYFVVDVDYYDLENKNNHATRIMTKNNVIINVNKPQFIWYSIDSYLKTMSIMYEYCYNHNNIQHIIDNDFKKQTFFKPGYVYNNTILRNADHVNAFSFKQPLTLQNVNSDLISFKFDDILFITDESKPYKNQHKFRITDKDTFERILIKITKSFISKTIIDDIIGISPIRWIITFKETNTDLIEIIKIKCICDDFVFEHNNPFITNRFNYQVLPKPTEQQKNDFNVDIAKKYYAYIKYGDELNYDGEIKTVII